jgi:hypothetical protein
VSRTLEYLYWVVTHLLAIPAGKDATRKLVNVRDWIKSYTPPTGTSPSKNTSSPSQRHVGTLVTNLASIGLFAFDFS